jgi:hypothetical protein
MKDICNGCVRISITGDLINKIEELKTYNLNLQLDRLIVAPHEKLDKILIVLYNIICM